MNRLTELRRKRFQDMTNVEMSELLGLEAKERRECIDRGECCGDVPDSDGCCLGTRLKCPKVNHESK